MVETTSVREEKLSARERLKLIQTINALPQTQFDELAFALNPPKGVVASSTAAQGTRSKDLLDWLEGSSGPGLTAADEVLQVLIPKATKTAPQPVAFVMMGQMGDLLPSELEAIAELLRQKTGDASISLAFSSPGSIKLILNGSPKGLAKLQEIFEAGELEQLYIPPVEAVTPVDTNSQDARKARLIQALRLPWIRVNLASDLARDREIARGLNLRESVRGLRALYLRALDRESDRARALNLRARALNFRDLDLEIESDLEIASDLALALDRAFELALDLASDLAFASEIAFALESDLDLDRARARARDLARDLARCRDLARARARESDSARDLSKSDLSGANLRDINLRGVDLTGADLTHADVTGTIFGDNPGLTEADKRNLQSRGAIFLDPPI